MSLDIYLRIKGAVQNPAGPRIYIRDDGQIKEISLAEWDTRFPDREPVTVVEREDTDCIYRANITHNLATMATHAGLYQPLWRPEEMGVTQARQLVDRLQAGLRRLQADPGYFRTFNPSNGWGTYEGLVQFTADYMAACERWPDTEVSVSR